MAEKSSEIQLLGVFEGTLSAHYVTKDQVLESMIREKISADNLNLNLNHIEFEIQTDSQNPDYVSLDYLPTIIFENKALRKLLACDNEIHTLPFEIGNLLNLEELDLSNNLITLLPKELGKLSNLKYLNLSNNQLSSLPLGIGQLINLTSLDISNNQLTDLPAEMKQLISLKRINISKNDLPLSSYRNLPKIEEFIDDNYIDLEGKSS